MPAGLSALNALTELSVQSTIGRYVCFGWLSQLKSVEDVTVSSGADYTVMPKCLSALSKITKLHLSSRYVAEVEYMRQTCALSLT